MVRCRVVVLTRFGDTLPLASPALPPPHPQVLGTWQLGAVGDLAPLRAELTRLVASTAAEAAAERARGLVLVCSELATNALVHARSRATVHLRTDGATYLLEVVDRAPHALLRVASGREPGAGGFGLVLAGRIAREVGWFTTAETKHVWVTYPVGLGAEAQTDPPGGTGVQAVVPTPA